MGSQYYAVLRKRWRRGGETNEEIRYNFSILTEKIIFLWRFTSLWFWRFCSPPFERFVHVNVLFVLYCSCLSLESMFNYIWYGNYWPWRKTFANFLDLWYNVTWKLYLWDRQPIFQVFFDTSLSFCCCAPCLLVMLASVWMISHQLPLLFHHCYHMFIFIQHNIQTI